MDGLKKQAAVSGLALFGSMATLVCCALPALLVTLGAGAVLAGLVSAVPQLVVLSVYKTQVFAGAAVLLAAAGIFQWRQRRAPCPADPAQAKTCARLRRAGTWIYALSLVLYLTGFFFAFIAPELFF